MARVWHKVGARRRRSVVARNSFKTPCKGVNTTAAGSGRALHRESATYESNCIHVARIPAELDL